jgi:cobalt-zinc-cadmium efflux system protein
MEGTPVGLDVTTLEATILATDGVATVHDLHVWSLTPGRPMLTAHVVIEPWAHGTIVAAAVGERLRAAHGIAHVTIQPEPPAAQVVPLRIRPPRDGTA